MVCRMFTWRLLMALLVAPLSIPLLVLLYLISMGYVQVDLNAVGHYIYFNVYRAWPVLAMIYIGHLFLLLPFGLLLAWLHKLRLAWFLAGAYLLGSLTNTVGYPLIDPTVYVAGGATGMIIITSIIGGTYGFFHGYLFWFLAGLHRLAPMMRQDLQKARRHADAG